MDCATCAKRLIRPAKRLRITIPSRKAFHTSPAHSRLGAFTYAQEWQTGTYHFNKALTQTYPVAAKRTDELLTNWMTQYQLVSKPRSNERRQKQKQGGEGEASDASAGGALTKQQLRRIQVAAQRRQLDTVLVSKSTAKDFGDRVEVTAFIYDGIRATEQEDERRRATRMGVKPDSGGEGGNKRGPVRRRGPARLSPAGSGGPGERAGGARAGPGAGVSVRRLNLGGGAARSPSLRTPGTGRTAGPGAARGEPRFRTAAAPARSPPPSR